MGKAGAAGTRGKVSFPTIRGFLSNDQRFPVADVITSDNPKTLPFTAVWPHKHMTRWVSTSEGHGLRADRTLIPGPTEIRLRWMGR